MQLKYTFLTQIVSFSTFKQPCLDKWFKIRNKPAGNNYCYWPFKN